MNNKKELGQYFTINNPFDFKIFKEWINLIPNLHTVIEPFAGSNNLINCIEKLGYHLDWKCYDIDTSFENFAPKFQIEKRDTIKNFPKGIDVAITNPPYLAKNSASRLGLAYEYPEFDDLYKKCLQVMLDNCKYVAAIIPESFITSNLFTERLLAVVSLTCKMFNDTDCPVCLALFIPKKKLGKENDFLLYRLNTPLGLYSDIISKIQICNTSINWKFNDPNGEIGIICVDNTNEASIKFIQGTEIDSNDIKVSSRAFTRVSGLPEDINLDKFLLECNKYLQKYREFTNDIFLTSFKGLRKDNRYRRRLDFKTAKQIMNLIVLNISNNAKIRS